MNLRANPSSSAAILKVVPKETVVVVYTCGTKWCKVKAQQNMGWLVASALTTY